MGQAYSLNGYINAVLRRSATTLLVEGKTDALAIHRLVAERKLSHAQIGSVDQSSLVTGEDVSGFGAKEKILAARHKAKVLEAHFPELATKLAYLVDREWDGIDFSVPCIARSWQHPVQEANYFVTLGHSIENYHFCTDFVEHLIKNWFPDAYSAELAQSIHDHFCSAVSLAGALSSVAREEFLLTRITGLIRHEHIEVDSLGVRLSDRFETDLEGRGVPEPAALRDRVNQIASSSWSVTGSHPNASWVLHGHVGSEVIWAVVAKVCLMAGLPASQADRLGHGAVDERRRLFFGWLADRPEGLRIPLDSAAAWVCQTGVP